MYILIEALNKQISFKNVKSWNGYFSWKKTKASFYLAEYKTTGRTFGHRRS